MRAVTAAAAGGAACAGGAVTDAVAVMLLLLLLLLPSGAQLVLPAAQLLVASLRHLSKSPHSAIMAAVGLLDDKTAQHSNSKRLRELLCGAVSCMRHSVHAAAELLPGKQQGLAASLVRSPELLQSISLSLAIQMTAVWAKKHSRNTGESSSTTNSSSGSTAAASSSSSGGSGSFQQASSTHSSITAGPGTAADESKHYVHLATELPYHISSLLNFMGCSKAVALCAATPALSSHIQFSTAAV